MCHLGSYTRPASSSIRSATFVADARDHRPASNTRFRLYPEARNRKTAWSKEQVARRKRNTLYNRIRTPTFRGSVADSYAAEAREKDLEWIRSGYHEDHIAACSCHRARRNSRGRERRGTTEYLLTTTTIPRKHRMEASWESAAGTRIPGALVLITSLEALARRPKITFRPFFAPMADLRVAVSLDSNSAPSEPPSRGLQTIRNTHIRPTL